MTLASIAAQLATINTILADSHDDGTNGVLITVLVVLAIVALLIWIVRHRP